MSKQYGFLVNIGRCVQCEACVAACKTTHNLEQARQAIADGADYISVGPIYATPTKPGRPAVGLQYVRVAALNVDIPFVGAVLLWRGFAGSDHGTVTKLYGACPSGP